jgi:hypothetical protein
MLPAFVGVCSGKTGYIAYRVRYEFQHVMWRFQWPGNLWNRSGSRRRPLTYHTALSLVLALRGVHCHAQIQREGNVPRALNSTKHSRLPSNIETATAHFMSMSCESRLHTKATHGARSKSPRSRQALRGRKQGNRGADPSGLDIRVLGVCTGAGVNELDCALVWYRQDVPSGPLRVELIQVCGLANSD